MGGVTHLKRGLLIGLELSRKLLLSPGLPLPITWMGNDGLEAGIDVYYNSILPVALVIIRLTSEL